MNEEDLKQQARMERERSIDFVTTKRTQFIDDMRLYNNEKSRSDLIGDTTFFNVHSALVARSFSDKNNVVFSATKLGADDEAERLNSVFNEDYESDDYSQMKYWKEWDRYFYGVAIRTRKGWN